MAFPPGTQAPPFGSGGKPAAKKNPTAPLGLGAPVSSAFAAGRPAPSFKSGAGGTPLRKAAPIQKAMMRAPGRSLAGGGR